MRAIFISYRREDAEGQAGRLFDDLTKQFGDNAVFMDVAGIAAGRDFRRVIEEQVASCGVLLTMIGKDWLDIRDESGRRRLDDPADFVRLETASALKRDIPVIPVLVQGARMPRKEQLPEELADLAFRNGVELTHARWDSDVEVLIKALSPHVGSGTGKPRPTGPAASRPWTMVMVVAGLLAAIVMAGGGYAWYQASVQKAKEQELAGEKRKQDELAEKKRIADEKRKQDELAERRRLAEEKRRQDEASEKQRLAEEKRKQDELAERQRLLDERKRSEAILLAERERLAAQRKPAVQSYPMTCRGGGALNVASAGTAEVRIRFQAGRGPATSGLAPGQCTWADRALGPSEPTTICDSRTRAGQYAGSLARSDQYVIFQVYNDNQGCMRVTRVGP